MRDLQMLSAQRVVRHRPQRLIAVITDHIGGGHLPLLRSELYK